MPISSAENRSTGSSSRSLTPVASSCRARAPTTRSRNGAKTTASSARACRGPISWTRFAGRFSTSSRSVFPGCFTAVSSGPVGRVLPASVTQRSSASTRHRSNTFPVSGSFDAATSSAWSRRYRGGHAHCGTLLSQSGEVRAKIGRALVTQRPILVERLVQHPLEVVRDLDGRLHGRPFSRVYGFQSRTNGRFDLLSAGSFLVGRST